MWRCFSTFTAAAVVAVMIGRGDGDGAVVALMAFGLLVLEWKIARQERRLRDAGL